MKQLIKRDLMLNKYPELFLVVLAVPLVYFLGLPPIFYLWFMLFPVLAINLFYYDDKSHINRFLIALPIEKKLIVRGRYLYLLSLHAFAIAYQWIASLLNIQLTPDLSDHFVFNWKEAVVMVSGIAIITAFVVPCYYVIRSFYAATIVAFILIYGFLFVSLPLLVWGMGMEDWILINKLDQGYVPLLEQHFSNRPFLLLILLAAALFLLSMKITEHLFVKQDQ